MAIRFAIKNSNNINNYIIFIDNKPIGTVRFYNAYDIFETSELTKNSLPENLASFELLTSETDYLQQNKNIYIAIIKLFIKNYIFKKYKYVFVSPDCRDERLINIYEQAGFEILRRVDNLFWMVACNKIIRLSIKDLITLEILFKKYFLSGDRLWVFGSRADLHKTGGDIDLYIETNIKNIDMALQSKCDFLFDLEQKIGEQKIDIVLNLINFPYFLEIYHIAKTAGVRII